MLMYDGVCSQAARSVLQTLIGVWLFRDILTVYVRVNIHQRHPDWGNGTEMDCTTGTGLLQFSLSAVAQCGRASICFGTGC